MALHCIALQRIELTLEVVVVVADDSVGSQGTLVDADAVESVLGHIFAKVHQDVFIRPGIDNKVTVLEIVQPTHIAFVVDAVHCDARE